MLTPGRLLLFALALVLACVLPPSEGYEDKACAPGRPCPAGYQCWLPVEGAEGTCHAGAEGFLFLGCVDAGVGEACSVGLGACARAGTLLCDARGRVVCSAEEGEQGEESCNRLDDDCDGQTDEELRGDAGCALALGVCEGSRPACTGGDYEVACTEASYGPEYEWLERSLDDGLDNDCDGREDLSRLAPLLEGRGARQVALRSTPGGLALAYTARRDGGTRVYHQVVDSSLRPVGDEVLLGSSAEAEAVGLVGLGDDSVLAWSERAGGTRRLVVTRLDPEGREVFRPDGGTEPGRVVFGLSATPPPALGPPRLLATGSILVAWRDGASPQLFGAVVSATGEETTRRARLSEAPLTDAGAAADLVGGFDVAYDALSRLMVAWASTHSGGTQMQFRKFIVGPQFSMAHIPEANRRVAATSPEQVELVHSLVGDVMTAAWVERLSGPPADRIRVLDSPGTGTLPESLPSPQGRVGELRLLPGNGHDTVLLWSAGSPPGLWMRPLDYGGAEAAESVALVPAADGGMGGTGMRVELRDGQVTAVVPLQDGGWGAVRALAP